MKKFIGHQLYRFSLVGVGAIPRGLLRWTLRALHLRPEFATRVGYHVYTDSYGNPFPEAGQVDEARLKLKRHLPGVTIDIPKAQALLTELASYSGEAKKLVAERPAELVWMWDDTYPPADIAVLHSMLRYLKPKRYIEVGCGFSSRTSTAALLRNAEEGSHCESLFVEPVPADHLADVKLPGEFRKEKIQQIPLERFKRLEAGDVLFIDTSHVIKVQNDVEYELLQVLPSLNAGVWVHIHDIFTPYDYPPEWLIGNGPNRGGNNEQYALECLLSGGDNWEVVMPSFLLWKDHNESFKQLSDATYRPASFWIRKMAPPRG